MSAHVAAARRALGLVDLTDLSDHCTPDAIAELCRRATGPAGSTAAVCIWPPFVTQATGLLRGTGVRVATVVNFPGGGDDIDATVAQTKTAIGDGADEIDLVLPYHSFLAGRPDLAAAMVDAVRSAAGPATLKLILETGSYPDLDSMRRAARLAIAHGADFVKTSTGKTSVSATMAATVMLLDAIRDASRDAGRSVGIKPSGGIRTLDEASRFLALADEMMGPQWASPSTFRFGASGLLDALEATITSETGTTGEPGMAGELAATGGSSTRAY